MVGLRKFRKKVFQFFTHMLELYTLLLLRVGFYGVRDLWVADGVRDLLVADGVSDLWVADGVRDLRVADFRVADFRVDVGCCR